MERRTKWQRSFSQWMMEVATAAGVYEILDNFGFHDFEKTEERLRALRWRWRESYKGNSTNWNRSEGGKERGRGNNRRYSPYPPSLHGVKTVSRFICGGEGGEREILAIGVIAVEFVYSIKTKRRLIVMENERLEFRQVLLAMRTSKVAIAMNNSEWQLNEGQT